MNQFRWGILGTGRIAGLFAEGLAAVSDASLVAVGSRTQASADRFADRFSVPRRYASYQSLAEDRDVDAVYISTPHNLHRENTLQCLHAGRAVLWRNRSRSMPQRARRWYEQHANAACS